MARSPVHFEVTVTTDWQEVRFPFIPQVVVVANISSAGGTIRFKVNDDNTSDAGARLEAFTALDRRVLDAAVTDRVLFRSDDLNQVIYVEGWK